MTRNTIIGVIIAVIILIVAIVWVVVGRQTTEVSLTPSPSPITTPIESPLATASPEVSEEVEQEEGSTQVMITENGFSPKVVNIKAGGSITWVNNTDKEVQIGANPHPVHTGNREVSGGEFVLELEPGQQETVTIVKTGTFGFHDHLNPSVQGQVVSE